MRTAIITKIKGLSIQTQQNTFVLFTLVKLTLDERKTLTKISMRKPLTTIPQTSAHLGHEGTRKPANRNLRQKAVCKVIDGGHEFHAIYLPSVLIFQVLRTVHDDLGHNGFPRTYAALK